MHCPAAYHQGVTFDYNRCPLDVEEIAESRAMGTLPMESAIAFEYVACAGCAAVIQEAAEYVDAVRAAAGRMRGKAPSHMK